MKPSKIPEIMRQLMLWPIPNMAPTFNIFGGHVNPLSKTKTFKNSKIIGVKLILHPFKKRVKLAHSYSSNIEKAPFCAVLIGQNGF